MTTYTYPQLVGFAQNAGFTGQNAYTAAAIGMAESSGNPNAIAYNDGGKGYNSYGLMQINGVNDATVGGAVNALDPQTAFNQAYTLSGGTNFSPWSTYNSGAYQNYLDTSVTSASAGASNGGGITYTAPSDFAPAANTNGGYGSSPYGLLGYGNTSPYYDPTYIDPSGGAAVGPTQATGTAGSGAPVQLAFGQQLTQSVGGWVANTTNAVTGAIQGAASNWLLSLDNWFMRGIVMVVGLALIILALRSVLEGTSVGEQAKTAGRAARGGTRRAISAATAEV